MSPRNGALPHSSSKGPSNGLWNQPFALIKTYSLPRCGKHYKVVKLSARKPYKDSYNRSLDSQMESHFAGQIISLSFFHKLGISWPKTHLLSRPKPHPGYLSSAWVKTLHKGLAMHWGFSHIRSEGQGRRWSVSHGFPLVINWVGSLWSYEGSCNENVTLK